MLQLRHPLVVEMRNNRTSLRRNRVTPRQQLPQTVVLQTAAPHKLDVWLPRLSNIAQVVLLALTAGAFYLTVLPLYQKALLDEAFARKEIELKQVTATLDAKYAKLREVAVRVFVINADADCSGFSEVLPATRNAPTRNADNLEVKAFTIDVKKCLLDHEAKAPSLAELRPDDRAFFQATVAAVADRIAKLQPDAAASYWRAEADINASNIDAYANKSEFTTRALAVLSRYMQPEDVAAHRRKQAVAELRAERLSAYRNEISAQLRTLIKMKWPTQHQ
jgi:hypothetical protein